MCIQSDIYDVWNYFEWWRELLYVNFLLHFYCVPWIIVIVNFLLPFYCMTCISFKILRSDDAVADLLLESVFLRGEYMPMPILWFRVKFTRYWWAVLVNWFTSFLFEKNNDTGFFDRLFKLAKLWNLLAQFSYFLGENMC